MSKLNETGRDLMLRAMISIAAADGEIADVETAMVSAIFEKVAGELVEMSEVDAAARSKTLAASLSEDLAEASGQLDDFAKESIVQAAYLVLVADGTVAETEREKLMQIGDAMGMPGDRVAAILHNAPR